MATLVSIGTSQRHCWVGCELKTRATKVFALYQPDRLHLILGFNAGAPLGASLLGRHPIALAPLSPSRARSESPSPERGKIMVRERFAPVSFVDEERIAAAIELTRFPVPDGREDH